MVDRYFEVLAGRYHFQPSLRRALVFGRHDLIQDAPISKLDLLICRNTLIYFTSESQGRILGRFNYALKDDGFLFLGRSEMLLTHARLFTPIDLKQRVFAKARGAAANPDRGNRFAEGPSEATAQLGRELRLRELAGDQVPVAQLVVDAAGILVAANGLARLRVGLAPTDVGRPFQDLEVSYRPVELREPIARAAKERKPVWLGAVRQEMGEGAVRFYDVNVVPLLDDDGGLVGTGISFVDTTDSTRLRTELERTKQDVETAYEEVQSSNEELETTNEELQSTVEELETTNEELQSSNEELETMNEELESTNSELQAINTDLRLRTDEIDRLNTLLGSILESVEVGVAVLDEHFRVLMWNTRAQELWGLRSDEVVDRGFFELDIGLPVEELRRLIQQVLGAKPLKRVATLAATNRRGRSIRCQVSVSPILLLPGRGHGAIILMDELT
jgi:two-component system CheB/CheR fusion protein